MNQSFSSTSNEGDFIRRKYITHALHISLTLLLCIFLLALDIKCITEGMIDYIFAFFQITYCLLIVFLAFQEFKYYSKVSNGDFEESYSDIITLKNFQILFIIILILYVLSLTLQIINIYIPISKGEKTCNIIYNLGTIYEYGFAAILTIAQFIMLFIPLKILKTLKIFQKKDEEFRKFLINEKEMEEYDFDIVVVDGRFEPISQKRVCNQVSNIQLNNPICFLCFSKIKLNQRISLLECGHFYHQQCFMKYSKSLIKKGNKKLICKCCLAETQDNKANCMIFRDLKQK